MLVVNGGSESGGLYADLNVGKYDGNTTEEVQENSRTGWKDWTKCRKECSSSRDEVTTIVINIMTTKLESIMKIFGPQ